MKTLCLAYQMLIIILDMLGKTRFDGIKEGIVVGPIMLCVMLKDLKMTN